MINRTAEPFITIPENLIIPEAEKINLDNGAPVYVVNAGTQELSKIEIIFPAGEIYSEQVLVATATNELLDEGTNTKTAFQIAEAFDYFGAYLETESTPDYASVKLFSLNKFLDNTLPLLNEIITEANFPEAELQTYVAQNKQRLSANKEKVDYLARKNFNKIIFSQNHPYGYVIEPENYDNLTQQHLLDFHKKTYSLSNAIIIVAGKINKKEIDSINKIFGQQKLISQKPTQPIYAVNESILSTKKIRIEKENTVQCGIRIGKRLFNKMHPDFHGMIVLSTILGGYFGSRLMANIREDKGYTYGIGSSVVSLKQSGYFTISTQVGKEVCEPALVEIYKEIKRMQQEPVSIDELQLVKNYLSGVFQRSIDGPFALSDKFKNLTLYNLDYSYYHDYLNLLKTISPQEISELATKHLDLNTFSEVIAG